MENFTARRDTRYEVSHIGNRTFPDSPSICERIPFYRTNKLNGTRLEDYLQLKSYDGGLCNYYRSRVASIGMCTYYSRVVVALVEWTTRDSCLQRS